MTRPVNKVPIDPNKHEWHPSALPGQIVVVSTYNPDRTPNIAPKSWISMVAFEGPILAFGCNTSHGTFRNVEATGAFVVNVPHASLVQQIWRLPAHRGRERVEQSGLTLIPARAVDAPIVAECRAHLECELDDVKRYGDEVLLFGRIVAVTIDADCLDGDVGQQYHRLAPVFFLEEQTYAGLDLAHRVGSLPPADQVMYVIELGPLPHEAEHDALLVAHLEHLSELRAQGQMGFAGVFEEGDEGTGAGRMYAIVVDSPEQARAVTAADPLALAGASVTIRTWRRSF